MERREGYAKEKGNRIMARLEKRVEKWTAVVVRGKILEKVKKIENCLKIKK